LEKAKALHAEELAHLTRFDERLKELDKGISKKKDAIADCDVQLTKFDGELRGLEVQRQEALGHLKHLEKEQWIKEQCQ
jgi:chromosome segregation ATPase